MTKRLTCLLAALLLTGCSTVPTAAARRPDARPQARALYPAAAIFPRLDADADGKLALAEFRQLGLFGVNGRIWEPAAPPPLPEAQEATYKSFDKDRDGAVSSREFENFGVALQYGLESGSPAQLYFEMFPTLDLDQDHRLSPAEWAQLGVFGANGVGPGTLAPVQALPQLLQATFKRFDRDQDGFLGEAELTPGT